MQWEHLPGAATRAIADDADTATSDGSRRRAIAAARSADAGPSILSTEIGDDAPHTQERIEQARASREAFRSTPKLFQNQALNAFCEVIHIGVHEPTEKGAQ